MKSFKDLQEGNHKNYKFLAQLHPLSFQAVDELRQNFDAVVQYAKSQLLQNISQAIQSAQQIPEFYTEKYKKYERIQFELNKQQLAQAHEKEVFYREMAEQILREVFLSHIVKDIVFYVEDDHLFEKYHGFILREKIPPQ